MDEIGLSNAGKPGSTVSLQTLVRSIKDRTGSIKRKVKKTSRKAVIGVPLEGPAAQEAQRKVDYKLTKKAVSKWEPIIYRNRNISQLEFPLNQSALSVPSCVEIVQRYQPQTEMEKEIQSLLTTSDNVLSDKRVLTVAEEKYLKAMSLKEAKERHKELQKMRALLSYQEAKYKRQKKIKSKGYHRLLKREKLKKEMKAFEEAKSKNPKKALEKIEELDKLRALERATLRHRNTGKWSKHNQLRAKYDPIAREALSEQLKLNQKLLEKTYDNDKSEDENNSLKTDIFKKTKQVKKVRLNSNTNVNQDLDDLNSQILSDFAVTEIDSPKEAKILPKWNDFSKKDFVFGDNVFKKCEAEEIEEATKHQKEFAKEFNISEQEKDSLEENCSHSVEERDLDIKKISNEMFSNLMKDEKKDEEEEQQKLVAEAFAEDDVVKEFLKEKQDDIEKYTAKDICNYLPGWGSWAGPGIKTNIRKKKKFTIKAKQKERKDKHLGNVIISAKKDEIITKYMIQKLPKKDTRKFLKTCKMPVGNNWNNELTYRRLIEPKIVTKLGRIIEPIDEETTFKL